MLIELIESFGATLLQLRQEKNLSQQRLAYKAELDRSTIFFWESSYSPNRNPTMITFLKLCEGLEIEPEDFIVKLKEVHNQRKGAH